jgi:hypothetical protein
MKILLLTGRFAAMAGVARRTITAEFQRYCLVASVLRPATAASRWDVTCNAWTAQCVSSRIQSEFQTVRGAETLLFGGRQSKTFTQEKQSKKNRTHRQKNSDIQKEMLSLHFVTNI